MRGGPVHNAILISVLLFTKLIGSQHVTKVSFQVDGRASTESMLDAGYGVIPRLSQITVCFRLFLVYYSDFSPIVSYFMETDNELFIAYESTHSFEFICCKGQVFLNLKRKFNLREWNHVCIAADMKTRQYWFSMNGAFEEGTLTTTGPTGEIYVKSGGHMVVGQDLDTLDGGFTYQQSLRGELAQFQLFSEALDPSYLKMYSYCQSPVTDTKPILHFETDLDSFQVKGSVAVSDIALETLCNQRKQTLYILPEQMEFSNAEKACELMKGDLPVPKSKAENEAIFDGVSQFSDVCVDSYGVMYWLGIKGDIKTKTWHHIKDSSEIMWDNFDDIFSEVSSTKYCACVGGKDFPYMWYATDCELKTCPLCNFSHNPSFTVRGLCRNTIIDGSFSLHEYRNMKMQLLGPLHTRIYWDNVDMTWIMDNRNDPGFKGIMQVKSQYDLPLGFKTWDFTGDRCTSSTVEMLITACNSSEFTCSNSMCIRKDKRCDKTIDCPDDSDEIDCSVISVPAGYNAELPPPGNDKGPFSIELFLGVTSVREVNILGLKLLVDAVIEIHWRDSRLQMKHLHDDTQMNKVHIRDFANMWLPNLQIEGGASTVADLVSRSMSLMVKRESDPLPDDVTQLHEDDIYLGTANSLYQRQVDTIGFTCAFQLHSYPFDKQTCSLTFKLIDVSSDLAILSRHGAGVAFLGERQLLEYEVTMVNMTFINSSDGQQGQKVIIELRNLYGYYISNTYVPTTLLIVIGYLTLFFDVNDFTDRVMVSLTSLLVLGSLFTTTSHSIPKTSYLKLIDLWFVALIVSMFLIILLLVIIENLRTKNMRQMSAREVQRNVSVVSTHGSKPVALTDVRKGKDHTRLSSMLVNFSILKDHVFVNFLAQILLPIFMMIFLMFYGILCL